MATIEERALQTYPVKMSEYSNGREYDFNESDRLTYIEGATDQQKIDIEKAWKAHCNLCHYKVVGGCEVYASYSHCPDVKLIKKALEK